MNSGNVKKKKDFAYYQDHGIWLYFEAVVLIHQDFTTDQKISAVGHQRLWNDRQIHTSKMILLICYQCQALFHSGRGNNEAPLKGSTSGIFNKRLIFTSDNVIKVTISNQASTHRRTLKI